jgi:hypothetical protein
MRALRPFPLLAAVAAVALGARPVAAQTTADSVGIRRAALDYVDGWYTADGPRMESALHPELAKRIVVTDPANGRSRLMQQSAMTLVLNTRGGGGSQTPAAERRHDVAILDIYGGAASARVRAANWVDYLHLAKVNGRWVIVNVLWEMDPR